MKVSLISTNNNCVEHGLRSMSSYLLKNNIQTQILFLGLGLDYNKKFSKAVLEQLKEQIKDSDLIGITTMSLCWPRAKELIAYLKKELDIPIILGGIHATVFPEECIEYVDYLCLGEGEITILDLLNKKQIDTIPNLYHKTDGKKIKNQKMYLHEFLDDFGTPDYDFEHQFIIKNDMLVKFNEEDFKNVFTISTTRGCPHSCTYCINNFFYKLYKDKGKIIRKRSIGNVIKELESMKNKFKTIKSMFISDDTFFYRDLEDIKKFCEEYKSKIGIPFSCYVSPLTMNDEKMKMMVEAGLNGVLMGIQTGSRRTSRELYKRNVPKELIIKAAHILNKYSDSVNIDYQFIITNPYESQEDLLETINLIKDLPKPFTLTTFNLAFFKGTELYDKAKQDGLIKSEEDTATQYHFYDIINHLKQKKLKNRYLNSLLYWMSGKNTNIRYGFVPAFVFKILLKKSVVALNNKIIFPTMLMNRFKTKIESSFRPPV